MQSTFAISTGSAARGIIAAQATSDEMLLESIAAGEKAAMHVLYARHNVRVYRFILRIIGDTSVAEDLVSQVFLDVWRTAGQFEGRSQVSTWMLAIARFKALTASEYGLLKVFAANPKRVLSRERLLELANARDAEAFDRAIDLRIMRIRRKIEPDPSRPTVIRTIRGGGYVFSPTGDKA